MNSAAYVLEVKHKADPIRKEIALEQSVHGARNETLPSGLIARFPQKLEPPAEPLLKQKILFVTPEITGLVKTGGLGDVSAALPRALASNHDVRVVVPGYSQVLASGYPITIVANLDGYASLPACQIGQLEMPDGLIVYVILCPELYQREGSPYCDDKGNVWSDNHIRFARLSLAAAEISKGNSKLAWTPDLIHANDWQTGLAPAYMELMGIKTPRLFTIHNLAFQGLYKRECIAELGLPETVFSINEMEFYGQLSFLKAGIVYSNQITTVSETYAREITQPEFGCGLDGLLKWKFEQGLLKGITNGIDESWESSSDPHLVKGFSPHQWEAKRTNTRHLERMFNLRSSSGPLFAMVSRLAQQKGVDLTLEVAELLVKRGGRLAVMGCGEPKLEQELVKLAKYYPDHIGVHIGFNEPDARRIFAGSDFFLMPSRFEPCGLTQMYAQRFASLPIARQTGGLADTIEDGLSGFLFRDATASSFQTAITRALNVFERPALLNVMRCRAMASPLYWRKSAEPYGHLYQRLIQDGTRALKTLFHCGDSVHA